MRPIGTGHFFQRLFYHLGKTAVAEEDLSLINQGQRPFVHRFDQQAVRSFRPFEREDLIALRSGDHQRVHFALRDRAQGLFGFRQPRSKRSLVCSRDRHTVHDFESFLRKLSPNKTLSVSAKSPISRRSGGGNSLMSVGAAMIWSFFAKAGCW